MYYFLLTFSGPNSACRRPIDPQPPPIDLFVFIIFYKNNGVVVGVVLRPRGSEKCNSGVSILKMMSYEITVFSI